MKHNHSTIPSAIAALVALVIAVAASVHAQIPQVINPQGDVEFEFPSTDNAAFYRIEMK